MPTGTLPIYLTQVKSVYAAIAKRIEELLEVLNVIEKQDPHTRALAERITLFLKQLESAILREGVLAKDLPAAKKQVFLDLVHKELREVRALKVYIALAGRKPTPELIKKVHSLYQQVERELSESSALAAA